MIRPLPIRDTRKNTDCVAQSPARSMFGNTYPPVVREERLELDYINFNSLARQTASPRRFTPSLA